MTKISVLPRNVPVEHVQSGSFQLRRLGNETGRFVLKTVERNGQATTTNGKYVCVWKKQQDGKWKVVADIDNPDS